MPARLRPLFLREFLLGMHLQWEVAAILRYALSRIDPAGGQTGDAAHDTEADLEERGVNDGY